MDRRKTEPDMAKLNAAGGCLYYTSSCCDEEMRKVTPEAPKGDKKQPAEVKVEGLTDTLAAFEGGPHACAFCDKVEDLKPFKLKVG